MNKLILISLFFGHAVLGQAQDFRSQKISGNIKNGFEVRYDTTFNQSINAIEKRRIQADVLITFSNDSITKTIAINTLQYIQETNQKSALIVTYRYPDDSLKGDNITGTSIYNRQAVVSEPVDNAKGHILFKIAQPNILNLSEWKVIYWSYQKALIYIEADVLLGFTHRFLLSKSAKNDWNNFNTRQRNEFSKFGQKSSLRIGFNLKGTKSSLFAQIFQMHQGFTTKDHVVNSSTGLAELSPGNHNYSFSYQGLAAGYSFNSFRDKIGPAFDAGLYLARLKSFPNIAERKLTWGIFVSSGAKFRIAPRLDLRILPSFYLNFRTVSDAPVRTGLTSIGIGTGLRYYVL